MSLSDAKPSTQIDFDSLAFVRCSMGANQLYEIILKSIDRNISCIEASVTDVDRPLHTFVFYPKVLGHFISYVYPTTAAHDGMTNTEKICSNRPSIHAFLLHYFSDKDQVTQRKTYHANLNLLRPCLRRDDIYSFDCESQELKLINPHIGLKSLGKFKMKFLLFLLKRSIIWIKIN